MKTYIQLFHLSPSKEKSRCFIVSRFYINGIAYILQSLKLLNRFIKFGLLIFGYIDFFYVIL